MAEGLGRTGKEITVTLTLLKKRTRNGPLFYWYCMNHRANRDAMSPQPRPWFRFHLSTGIILMFIAGGLLWVNFQPRQVNWYFGRLLSGNEYYEVAVVIGWPKPLSAKLLNGNDLDVSPVWFSSLINLFCCSSILAASGIACEYLIKIKSGKQ